MKITLPYQFQPRKYQLPFLKALDSGYNRAVVVWHRRSGKDKTLINFTAKRMFERVGAYYYFFPTFLQGRKILWNGMDREGFKFMDHIPEEIRIRTDNTQMLIEARNGSIFQIIGTDNIDCYDDKTEILTDGGWRFFKDLKQSEKVATLTQDGALEYNKPIRYIKRSYSGEMYKVKSKAIDLLVTPNHKFYVKSVKGKYKFKEIKNISGYNDRIPATSDWDGKDKKTFVLPEIKRSSHDRSKKRNQVFDMKDWCAFMGIYLSEGSVYSPGKGNYRVYITQSEGAKGGVKGDVKKEIDLLLSRMGLSYNYDGKSFIILNRQLYEYLKIFGKSLDKYIPRELLGLSKPYLKELMRWLVYGDGTEQESGQIVYYSISKKLLNGFQELIIKLGYSGAVRVRKQKRAHIKGRFIEGRQIYYLVVRKSKYRYFRNTKKSYISKEAYHGMIYCVEVKNNIVKVRRNGVEVWSGNSIVGTNPVGCVFSEYALQDPRAWDFIRPILAENGGWAVFNFTPRGDNHGKDIKELAESSKEWFCEVLTVEDTNAIPKKILEQEYREIVKKDGNDALYQQEYMCSFDAPVIGAYYGTQLIEAKKRITHVPYEPDLLVNTYWDLGIGDSTTIWFQQETAQEIRFIDYYETSGEGLSHYAKILQEKGYVYGEHWAPHDIEVRELGTGKSRKEVAAKLGINFQVAPKLPIDDGIDAVRNILPKCWFDKVKCKRGLNALRNYHKEFDEKNKTYKNHPAHTWASHGADAMRYFAVSHRKADPIIKQDFKQWEVGT